MNRSIFAIMLIALVFMTGCESDPTTASVVTKADVLSLILPSSTVVGAEGTAISIPVSVQVMNDGKVSAGREVTFRVLAGDGDLMNRTVRSDAQGLASGVVVVTIPKGPSKVSVGAFTEQGATQGEVSLRATGKPARIKINDPDDNLVAPVNAPVKVSLTARITDIDGGSVVGIPVVYKLFGPDGIGVGDINGDSVSRADGSLHFEYSILCNGVREEIIVVTDTSIWKGPAVSGTSEIEVRTSLSLIRSFEVHATPSSIGGSVDSLLFSEITAQVLGNDNIGLPNIDVSFVTDMGALSAITPTNEHGIATARFSNNYESGIATILAYIRGTEFREEIYVTVYLNEVTGGVISVHSDSQFKYVDNGATFVNITAYLKDQDARPLIGRPIMFMSAMGAVQSPILTDSLGIARTIFVDLGFPSLDQNGHVVPTKIYAKYRTLNLVDSCEIEIRPSMAVTSINLTTNRQALQAGSEDFALVVAKCYLANGSFAPIGTTVRFEESNHNGYFVTDAVVIEQEGEAQTYYVAGQFLGTATLQAKVNNQVDGNDSVTYSNEVNINLVPGPPSGIRLNASPNRLDTNDPGMFSMITAIVTDTAGNPVRQGEIVRFRTTAGEIIPIALTDTTGRASTRLVPVTESGVAQVTAWVNLASGDSIVAYASVTFIAGLPNSIEISADLAVISVAGNGANSSTTVRALVKDANGNPVERATTVVFEVLGNEVPEGEEPCNINNHGLIDSARTANGLAVVTLNAGTLTGGVILRAYTWRDPDASNPGPDSLPRTDFVTGIFANISVVAGPPHQFDIDYNTDGEDIGGGVWEIAASARVYDSQSNPVAEATPVSWSVEPQVATIDPSVTDENGIAHTRIRYHSLNTFEQVTVSARIQTQPGLIENQISLKLPLQHGRIELAVDPGNWMFERDRANDTAIVRIWASLVDGHGISINNAPVLFTCDRGRLYWRNIRTNRYNDFFPQPCRRFTGLVNQENNENRGEATVYLRGVMDDFFLDAFSLEQIVRIEARIDGVDGVDAEPASVRYTRH